MTIYNPENNVPILYVPDQKVTLSEEGYAEFKAARDEGRAALYEASDNVREALEELQRAQAISSERAVAEGEEDPARIQAAEDTQARVEAAQEAYDAARAHQGEVEQKYLLVGHSVILHNKEEGTADKTFVGIGASDLDEAMKETIGTFDLAHMGPVGESSDVEFTPDWVASSHPLLGKLLADYYGCDQRSIAEVL